MGSGPLSTSEQRIRLAAETGELVDFRNDRPEDRIVRGPAIERLLLERRGASQAPLRAMRIRGAVVAGQLNLEAATLPCPLVFIDCSFDQPINLCEASAPSVRLKGSGSHVPGLDAKQLTTRGDLELSDGFESDGEVDLFGAHIGGNLDCHGGKFRNSGAIALNGSALQVDQNMSLGGRFDASGEVDLSGAQVGGQLDCDGGKFRNSVGFALRGDGLRVDRSMYFGVEAEGKVRLVGANVGGVFVCNEAKFRSVDGAAFDASAMRVGDSMTLKVDATGEVSLVHARITGQLNCAGSKFHNPTGCAFDGARLEVGDSVFLSDEFEAEGEVSLVSAHIGGQLICKKAKFCNANGPALRGELLRVDRTVFLSNEFSAKGEVDLVAAKIGGQLDCEDGEFKNPGGIALDLERSLVTDLILRPTAFDGVLNLTDARVVSSYQDSRARWWPRPGDIRLQGFVYERIKSDVSWKQRVDWLALDPHFSPQPYNQLASVYRRDGEDDDAVNILVAKLRRRRSQRSVFVKTWELVIDGSVRYGYRTGQAFIWLCALYGLGIALSFAAHEYQLLTPVSQTPLPEFNPFMYAADWIVPFLNLHQREAWSTHGLAQWLPLGLAVVGWALTTAVVVALSGVFKRD